MDRKDFLKYSGLLLLGVVGFKGVASLLSQLDKTPAVSVKSDQTPRGFGSGKYGV